MKVQIAKMGEPIIGGYNHVVCSDNYINFMDISDNECSEILAQDVLDNFAIDNIHQCISSLVGKLRLGGKLVVGGTDIRLFSRMVSNNTLNEVEASNILSSANSMTSATNVKPIIQSLGLQVISVMVSGIHFEITATRG